MSIIALFGPSDHTQQQYDQIIETLEAKGLAAPDGRLFHIAWNSPQGWRVLDVWESEEKLEKFAEVLKPIIADAGATPMQTQICPVHNMITG